MSFPKPPKPIPPPTPPVAADATQADVTPLRSGAASLINTTPTGLARKASTQKTSLIGG